MTREIAQTSASADERQRRDQAQPELLVHAGQTRSEVRHHMAVLFGQAFTRLRTRGEAFECRCRHGRILQGRVGALLVGIAAVKTWPVQPRVGDR